MGSCVSAVRLRFSFGSKNDKLTTKSHCSDKDIVVNVEGSPHHENFKEQGFRGSEIVSPQCKRVFNYGSKEEAFFDSQPWLDSDGEDDFLSVNGDFMPSQGNTPVQPSFSVGNPRVNDAFIVEGTLDSIPSPSSPDKKKRLSELFKESLHADQFVNQENTTGGENAVPANVETRATNVVLQYPKSTNGTPYLSGANSRGSSERTPNGLFEADDNLVKSAQCCLPRLLSSRSFKERRKRMSPASNLGSKILASI